MSITMERKKRCEKKKEAMQKMENMGRYPAVKWLIAWAKVNHQTWKCHVTKGHVSILVRKYFDP